MAVDEGHQLLSSILIERTISPEGEDQVWVTAKNVTGDDLPPLIEMLGMMDIARDTIWRLCMEEDEETEE